MFCVPLFLRSLQTRIGQGAPCCGLLSSFLPQLSLDTATLQWTSGCLTIASFVLMETRLHCFCAKLQENPPLNSQTSTLSKPKYTYHEHYNMEINHKHYQGWMALDTPSILVDNIRTCPHRQIKSCHTGTGVTDSGSFPPCHSIVTQGQTVLALLL